MDSQVIQHSESIIQNQRTVGVPPAIILDDQIPKNNPKSIIHHSISRKAPPARNYRISFRLRGSAADYSECGQDAHGPFFFILNILYIDVNKVV